MSIDEKVSQPADLVSVKFTIGFNPGTNLASFRKELEDLAQDNSVVVSNDSQDLEKKFYELDHFGNLDSDGNALRGYTLLLQTDPETYTKVFNTELTYQTWRITCIRPPTIILEKWVETNPAVIPEPLRDKIRYLQLQQEHVIDGKKYDLLSSKHYKHK